MTYFPDMGKTPASGRSSGTGKTATLSAAILKEYRRKRLSEGRSEATCNRELSMFRTAFNLGRKCTPPKVLIVPYFPWSRRRMFVRAS